MKSRLGWMSGLGLVWISLVQMATASLPPEVLARNARGAEAMSCFPAQVG